MKRYVLLFALFCCISSLVEIKATAQQGDRLIINKDTLQLLDCPIEYDTLLGSKVRQRLLKKSLSTGCWRRYVATWRILDNKLYLEAIQEYPKENNNNDVSLEGIFDAYKDEQGRILASWVSGKTYAASGKRLRYWNMDFYRNYEYETRYDIQKGVVVDEQHYQNYIKKSSLGEESPFYKDAFYKVIMSNFNGDLFPALANKNLKVDLSIRPNTDGQIDSLKILDWVLDGKKIKPFAANHPYAKELKRCLALVPDWKVSFIRGKIENIEASIDLWSKKGCRSITRNEENNDSIYINQKFYALRAFPLQYDTRLYARLLRFLPVNGLRNYTAIWELANERLYLKSIRLWNDPKPFPLEEIFPKARPGEPIEASWYDGETLCTQGETLNYSTEYYPTEILCTFNKGRLTSQTAYQNYVIPINEQSFQHRKDLLQSLDWTLDPGFVGKRIYATCTAYPNRDGKAEKLEIEISVSGFGKNYLNYKITDPDNPYIKACRKALEQVIWEVQYKRGQVLPTHESFFVWNIR